MRKNVLEELKKVFGESRVRTDEPMSAHTTFKIGGSAEYYLEVEKIEDLIQAVNLARKLGIAVFVLGGGSNIIVCDEGMKGLVVKNNCRRFEVLGIAGKVREKKVGVDSAQVYAESGVILNQLVRFTIEQGLSGLEYQLGLPGTVGGAVFMNSNFPRKGVYVGDCVYSAKLLSEGQVKEVQHDYFQFAYDKSILQETQEIVLSVVFTMKAEDRKLLWERGMEALTYRNETQPKGSSAGCTFRNISLVEAMQIPTSSGVTSAGYLIDKAGLKGMRVGNAMISDKHANFILNMGDAKASDVTDLVKAMKNEVLKKFGVHLSLEVRAVGF